MTVKMMNRPIPDKKYGLELFVEGVFYRMQTDDPQEFVKLLTQKALFTMQQNHGAELFKITEPVYEPSEEKEGKEGKEIHSIL
jgi:tagatose-1,6-bisphosphate aldolase